MTRLSLATTATAALLALSLPAAAAPFQAYLQDGQTSAHGPYESSGYNSSSFTGTGGSAGAGVFALKGDLNGNGAEDFLAWCVDIAHNLSPLGTYEVESVPYVGKIATDLAALVNTFYSEVLVNLNTKAYSAGFQLAVWEILNEPTSAYDVTKNTFAVSGGDDSAKTKANYFLANLDYSAPTTYNVTYLASQSGRQSLITISPAPVSPVPLPAAGVLLFGALGGLGMVARRRKSTDA